MAAVGLSVPFAALVVLALAAVGGAQQPPRQCSKAGRTCLTCDTMAVCLNTGDGRFETLAQPCRNNERCVLGVCVPGALCNYRPFACADEGYYPDPYDCREYHACVRNPNGGYLQVNQTCPSGQSYDAKTEGCIPGLQSTACLDGPLLPCQSVLQIGPVPGNANLYYVCLIRGSTLAPEIHRCPGGRSFSSTTLSCK